jgi:hypothetical protein
MLSGASLASRFWQYAFYHFLRLHNMTIHGDQVKTPYEVYSGRKPDLSASVPSAAIHCDQVKTPYEVCSGRKPDLSRLRTFGCHSR